MAWRAETLGLGVVDDNKYGVPVSVGGESAGASALGPRNITPDTLTTPR